MRRKQHSDELGYIAERVNPYVAGTKVVIYKAAEQGIDAWGHKYAVVCDAHRQIGGTDSVPKAREFMKQPEEFCTDCRTLIGE